MIDELRVDQRVSLSRTHHSVQVPSRKRLFQTIAEDLASPLREDREGAIDEIYDALVERERLGCTALGDGVAIPHCRTNCQEISGALYTLEEAIDYEAPDGLLVDLVFVLVVPEHEQTAHIAALQRLARIFSNPAHLGRLRAAVSDDSLLQELLNIDNDINNDTNVNINNDIKQAQPGRKLA